MYLTKFLLASYNSIEVGFRYYIHIHFYSTLQV